MCSGQGFALLGLRFVGGSCKLKVLGWVGCIGAIQGDDHGVETITDSPIFAFKVSAGLHFLLNNRPLCCELPQIGFKPFSPTMHYFSIIYEIT